MSKLHVVCVKWGTKYPAEYVNNLYAAVKRNSTVAYTFHCFTEDSNNINPNVIIHQIPSTRLDGWWNKLYMFDNDNGIPLGERIVFFDLDTLITGNIDQMLTHTSADIIVLRDLYAGISRAVAADNMGSGFMAWNHGKYNHVWKEFVRDPDRAIESVHPHGDQRWIQAKINIRQYWQDIFPNQVVSFKVHCRTGLPENARVVCYHGRPSIPESATQSMRVWKYSLTPQKWVLDHWNAK
jgi:hypothetical protein